MSTAELRILNDEPTDEQPAPSDPVELDGWFDYQLRQLAGIKSEMEHNRELMQRIVAPLQEQIDRAVDWCDEQNAVLARKAEYITSRIQQHAIGYDYRGKRSRVLPSGKFGHKQSPARLEVVDKAVAVESCKQLGIPVRVVPAKEEPDANAIKAYIKESGIEPDGCTLIPAHDAFYAEAGK